MNLREYYDYFIYVSPEGVEMEDNGVRETDMVYRGKIDKVIQMLLNEYQPTNLITVKGSTEERIATIISNIK